MNLRKSLIWALTGVYALCFAGFVVVGFRSMVSAGPAYEYKVFGASLPEVLAALLLGMAVSAALPWMHYRGDSYTASEETFYGVLLGVAVFGLILVVPLVLAT